MALWIWRHFRVEVPDEWEILQFTRPFDKGRCAFGDRYQIRLELSWRRADGIPNLQRSASDYIAKLHSDEIMEDAQGRNRDGWHGIDGHTDGLHTTRFMRYFARESCTLQVVFVWPEVYDSVLEGSVLRSIRAEHLKSGRHRRWRTFGMDLLARDGLPLTTCKVDPASVLMRFGDERTTYVQEFRRLGMVSHWLDGSVAEWIKLQVPRNLRVEASESLTTDGDLVTHIRGTRPARGLGLLMGKRRRYEARAWKSRRDGRLYMVTDEGPRGGVTEEVDLCKSLSESEGRR